MIEQLQSPHSESASLAPARFGILTLAALCIVAFVPGLLTLPVIDRDEARFAQASRQMAASDRVSDWLVPRVRERPRIHKPPLIYWLQASAARLDGEAAERGWTSRIWPYRLPSALASLLAVLVTCLLGREMFGIRAGLLAGALLAAAPMLMWETRQARADSVLLAMVVFAQWRLWHLWRDATRIGSAGTAIREGPGIGSAKTGWNVWLFWAAVGATAMTKGPIGPLVTGSTVLTLCVATGQWRWLKQVLPLRGMLLAAAPLAIWWIVVGFAAGWELLGAALRDEYLLRAVSAREGHSGPPGYHALLVWALCWPGSLLLLPGVLEAVRGVRRSRLDPAAAAPLFLLAWIAVPWLLFELAGTKLPHYVLPLYPAVVLLGASAAFAPRAVLAPFVESFWGRAGFHLWLGVGALIAVVLPLGLGVAVVAQWDRNAALAAVVVPALVAANALLLVHIRRCVRQFRFESAAWAAALAAASGVATGVVLFARISALHVSGLVVSELARIDAGATRPLAAVAYHEDSLIFLTRGRVERLDENEVAGWLVAHPRGLVVAPVPMEAPRPELRELRRAAGWNYSKGRRVELRIFEGPG